MRSWMLATAVVVALTGWGGSKADPQAEAESSPTASASSTTSASASATPTAEASAAEPSAGDNNKAEPSANPTQSSSPAAPASVKPSPSAKPTLGSFGPRSKQCKALSQVLMNASRIGLTALYGTVKQEDVDLAYANTAGVPKLAMPLVTASKTAAQDLVGLTPKQAEAYAPAFKKAQDALAAGTKKVCKR